MPSFLLRGIIYTYNRLLYFYRLFTWPLRHVHHETKIPTDMNEFDEVRHMALRNSDINDHLVNLFMESLSVSPKLIVELGVRRGSSTKVLERVAKIFKADLVSVDLLDYSGISSYEHWHFVRGDDITFAKNFPVWCQEQGMEPMIDILFIDTSHQYEHTVAEIGNWFPYLSPRAKVFFHDTNLRKAFVRRDGTIDRAADNNRGVIRAIEKYLSTSFFPEKRDFLTVHKGWIIKHYAYENGWTILERLNIKSTL